MCFLKAVHSSCGRRIPVFVFKYSRKFFKSAVNGETIKIASHPEIFPCPTSKTRNHSRNQKGMITWIRASFVHENIKLMVMNEFCVSIPRRHSRGIVRWLGVAPRCIRPIVPALAPALANPLIISIPPSIVVRLSRWFSCFCRPRGHFRRIFVEGFVLLEES